MTQQASKIDKVVTDLQADATRGLERAHAYLGAKPGPGIDIRITQLSNRSWKAEGRTPCGRAFILKVYGGDRYGAENQHRLNGFRQRAEAWGLTLETEWKDQPKVDEL